LSVALVLDTCALLDLDNGLLPLPVVARVVEEYGLLRAPLTDAVAFAAYTLPEPFHRDPADRMIVAFGRLTGRRVITSDQKIVDYARAGHVGVVPY
jgi:PIN domain nuclease of toxin-antitoxin system